MEVTAHYGARPSHAEWQGGVYSRSGSSTEYESLIDATGYGTGEGLMGWNCAHGMHPFFKGSARMYDKETLRDMKEHKVTYNGKEMGDYEASQLQRRMERGIRESKNTLTALNEQGKLTPSDEQKAAFAKEAVTLKKREARLKDFCNQTKRRSDTFRTQNMGFDRSVSQKAVWANKKSVANAKSGGIMKLHRSVQRKEKNRGAFVNLEIPMQKRYILQAARKYGISTKGLTLKIQRSEGLLSTSFYGSTDYKNVGRIDFFPNAFQDEEQLVRTLLHEKCHVKQLQKHGEKYVQENLVVMEAQAERFENFFFSILKKRVR